MKTDAFDFLKKLKPTKKFNFPQIGKPIKKGVRTFEINTYIGKKSVVYGNITTEDTIKIDGKFFGNIETTGDCIIGTYSIVEGNITANSIVISGVVTGNVNATDLLSLTKTAKLKGDVKMKSFLIDEGASFIGKSDLSSGKDDVSASKDMPSDGNNDFFVAKDEIFGDNSDVAIPPLEIPSENE